MEKLEIQKKKLRIKKSRGSLIFVVTLIYFAMLLGLIYLILRFQIPVMDGHEAVAPSLWFYMIWGFYYIVPIGMAIFLGTTLRPFWTNFRDLYVAILLIQGSYSLAIFIWRYQYLEQKKEAIYQTKMAVFKVSSFQPRFSDSDKNGVIDDVELLVGCHMDKHPLGRYILRGWITQRGQAFPDSDIGTYSITLQEDKPKIFTANFHFNPQVFHPYFESGAFEMNLLVQRSLPSDQKGNQIMAFNRWSPFLRFTSWKGDDDPQIVESRIDLEKLQRIGSFWLLPLDFQRPQVFFKRYLDDFGRDQDGDGLFEELVISMLLDSQYAGQIFLQANIPGTTHPIFYESSLKIGINELEFVMSGEVFKTLGVDGPFEISDLRIFNKNPGCNTEECLKRIKPFFTVYLDNYLTKKYLSAQFE
jgi:hypothetical protein